ncbi:MAG: type II toxin-antitoxin system RelE/ParE family toxin [Alphaproteobacteria bacterium]|nr:type II toxin-antitoxin system RelE/ParE family toxin [Alphaproteobacteria bacterium]MBV9692173.1 type II toxin-antitoxin system RelE/ParE family toxin [Alphaproteobacteria bacterium]
MSKRAKQHLLSIDVYIRERNPRAARRVAQTFRSAFELLTHHPYAGRPSHVAATRELSIARYPYVVVYEILPDAPDIVVILGVFHTSMAVRKL